ncbi:NfeD family protein [Peptostreptococcus canis]|uniref:NfeD family protein n=1 Tax=Peptostreptococcus canis TaxID=1159213 RepID=A0ABR6TM19_9FIRM|nr:NfeD family protein [Peptostreptococcus canis]MBC2576447.1 NfeD family protein [Peptostreptococcus canis]MBP1998422.1 membrane protein implicated in regulation of membrane protease activity [Peptostreptococcus canis]
MKRDIKKELKRDLVIILSGIIPMIVFGYLISNYNYFTTFFNGHIIYILYVIAVGILYISYLEARDNDPFVTGKTQTLGVNNSFIGMLTIAILMTKDIKTGVLNYIILALLLYISRVLGKNSYKNKYDKYVGKSGILIDIKNNKGHALIDDENVVVYTDKDIAVDSEVVITDIRSNYLYVE